MAELKRLAFTQRRLLKLTQSSEAKIEAQQILEAEDKVKQLVSNSRDRPPTFSVEELEELDATEIEFEATGLVFYIDE